MRPVVTNQGNAFYIFYKIDLFDRNYLNSLFLEMVNPESISLTQPLTISGEQVG